MYDIVEQKDVCVLRKKIFFILTLVWMCFIFYLSHQPASVSASQSGGFMNMLTSLPIVGGLLAKVMEFSFAEFLVRKSAHMFLYFVLAILIYMSIGKGIDFKYYIISFVLTALYACTDEFHQLYIIGRSGEIRDVLVDSTGALLGLILVYICTLGGRKKVRR